MASEMDAGYDLDCFKSPVPLGLHCSICKKVLRNPELCKDGGHPFCHYCIHEWLKRSENCPECKNPLTPETLVAPQKCFLRLLGDLKISCDYQERGCHSPILLGNLQDHVRLCECAPETCVKCGIQINRKDKENHEKNLCPIDTIIKSKENIKRFEDEMNAKLTNFTTIQAHLNATKNVISQLQDLIDKHGEMEQNQAETKERMERIEKLQSELKENQTEVKERMERMEKSQSELKTCQIETKEIMERIENNQNEQKNDVREIKQQFTLLIEKFNPGEDQPLSNNEMIARSSGPANGHANQEQKFPHLR